MIHVFFQNKYIIKWYGWKTSESLVSGIEHPVPCFFLIMAENFKATIHQRNMTCSIWATLLGSNRSPTVRRHFWVNDFPNFPWKVTWCDRFKRRGFPLGDVEEGPEPHCCGSSLLYCLKRLRDGWQMAWGGVTTGGTWRFDMGKGGKSGKT